MSRKKRLTENHVSGDLRVVAPRDLESSESSLDVEGAVRGRVYKWEHPSFPSRSGVRLP